MNRRILSASLTAATLLLAGSAHAVDSVSFNALPQSTVPASSGEWSVFLETSNSLDWKVTITGLNAPAPNADAQQITVSFFTPDESTQIGTVSGFGAVYNGAVQAGGNWNFNGAPSPNMVAGTNAAFGKTAGDTNWLLSPVAAPPAGNTGGTTFIGTFRLASVLSTGLVSVNIQDSGRQWNGAARYEGFDRPEDLVPEASGAAALLPALLPIGLVALKRRKAKKEAAAA